MDEIGLQAQRLSEVLDPLAAMIVKKIRPVDDDLSTNAAYKAFGRAWVEDQRRRGNIFPTSRGQRLIWSRAELETLRSVDLRRPEVVTTKHKTHAV